MLNLVQLQEELQNPEVKDSDLMHYANGGNPNIPGYMALSELNRRSQLRALATPAIEASYDEFREQVLASNINLDLD